LIGEDEVAVRPITGRGQADLPFVNGAALLASGKIALVVNVSAIVNEGVGLASSAQPSTAASADRAAVRKRLIVADDSITTRTLEQSVLEAAGYEVLTAPDGAEAWRLLQERGADLVVSDVEMPRMDGFALCQSIRASDRFRQLPLILVTALESAADRARGLEVGASAYLAKSSFDQETLLETIRQLVGGTT
jgi:two-component system chemotaxis sensor kinase CheA